MNMIMNIKCEGRGGVKWRTYSIQNSSVSFRRRSLLVLSGWISLMFFLQPVEPSKEKEGIKKLTDFAKVSIL